MTWWICVGSATTMPTGSKCSRISMVAGSDARMNLRVSFTIGVSSQGTGADLRLAAEGEDLRHEVGGAPRRREDLLAGSRRPGSASGS